jgi:hypothetical protein
MYPTEKFPIPVREFMRFLTDWVTFMGWLFGIVGQNMHLSKVHLHAGCYRKKPE